MTVFHKSNMGKVEVSCVGDIRSSDMGTHWEMSFCVEQKER